MTTDQALEKMKLNTSANDWDLIFNWVRQGEIRSKVFKELIEELIHPKEKTDFSFVQDKYAENRDLAKKDMDNYFEDSFSSPGGGKKKKKVI